MSQLSQRHCSPNVYWLSTATMSQSSYSPLHFARWIMYLNLCVKKLSGPKKTTSNTNCSENVTEMIQNTFSKPVKYKIHNNAFYPHDDMLARLLSTAQCLSFCVFHKAKFCGTGWADRAGFFHGDFLRQRTLAIYKNKVLPSGNVLTISPRNVLLT